MLKGVPGLGAVGMFIDSMAGLWYIQFRNFTKWTVGDCMYRMANDTYQIPKGGHALLAMIQSMVPEFLPTHSVCNSAEVHHLGGSPQLKCQILAFNHLHQLLDKYCLFSGSVVRIMEV